ncbi:hypothetical protein KJ765_04020 [Candidatus Micrarchaeota archaeon]|nr:hypothetical protein [Candidatus Micrarchaeota archaeon]
MATDVLAGQESVWDAVLVLLSLVLLYLIWSRRIFEFRSRPHALARKKKAFKSLQEKAAFEIDELKNKRKEVMGKVAESRKKYMKGNLNYPTYMDLSRRYDAELVELDAQLSALSEIAGGKKGKRGLSSGILKEMLSDDA